ncbi:MAG TPA: VIT1/CCC1 transporter family protein [Candidatus Dormibacteraeota bacterium]|nr:VIT1/CCC1 transporter family protein [Candidatus Dormibacteraeota bacterium]
MKPKTTVADLEAHKRLHRAGARLSDVILGGQDGIVNILGLVLGVAAASGSPRIIIAAALSTTFAESLSMAAVSYTSSQADRDYYKGQVEREKDHIQRFSDIEREEIRRIYQLKGFSGKQLDDIVQTITADVNRWVDVMMAEELKISPVEEGGLLRSAGIVGIAAIIGSLIPVVPFFGLPVWVAVWGSVAVAAASLFIVGAYKAKATVGVWWKSGLQLLCIGLVTALIGYAIGAVVARF